MRWLKPAVFTGALVPLVAIGARAATGGLGANPISEALNRLGLVALLFLVASLACTPAKLLWGWTWPLKLRRMLGLFAFFYATLHVGTYALLDQRLVLGAIVDDVVERPFILVGALAWAILVPLAITSTGAMVKRLGFARWKLLHRLAYAAGALGVVHFVMRVKSDLTEPLLYAAVLGVGLLVRPLVTARPPRHT